MSDEPKPKKKKKTQRDGLFLRNGIWWFRRVVNGKRVAVTTRYKDRNSARRRATEIEKDQNDGVFGWKPKAVVVVPTIEEYIKTSHAAHYSHGEQAEGALLKHAKFAQTYPGRRLDTFTKTECQGYLNSLPYASNTQRAHHMMLKSLWKRAIEDKLIADNPWEFGMLGEVARTRVMSYDEEVRLWPMLSPSVRRAATVAKTTGLRNGELCHIERRDVDWLKGVINVRAEIAKGKKGKKKARQVPLDDECAAVIREQIECLDSDMPEGHGVRGRALAKYFPRLRKNPDLIFPYAKTSLVTKFREFVEALGIPNLTIHDMRRTFATRFAENNTPMAILQAWMGHADISITAKFYTHIELRKYDMSAALKAQREALERARGAKVIPITKKTAVGE